MILRLFLLHIPRLPTPPLFPYTTLFRSSLFYDLAKTSTVRMAWALAKELAPHKCTAVALSPGWLRSEQMLDNYGVAERSEEHTSELQSQSNLVCRLLLEKKKIEGNGRDG